MILISWIKPWYLSHIALYLDNFKTFILLFLLNHYRSWGWTWMPDNSNHSYIISLYYVARESRVRNQGLFLPVFFVFIWILESYLVMLQTLHEETKLISSWLVLFMTSNIALALGVSRTRSELMKRFVIIRESRLRRRMRADPVREGNRFFLSFSSFSTFFSALFHE